MRTFAQKSKANHHTTSAKSAILGRSNFGQSHQVSTVLHLQRTIGNQSVQRMLQTHAEESDVGLTAAASPRFGHDFSQIPIHPPAAGAIQTKLAINKAGDEYEQEADRISEQVMRPPEPRSQRACACGGACPKCQMKQPGQEHERLQTKQVGSGDPGQTVAPSIVDEVFSSPGQPLDTATRSLMEPRFGHVFSGVRIHTDTKAAEAAQAINALAFTVGRDVVFGAGQYVPGTSSGQRLLAHELTHVIQQGRGEATRGLSGAQDVIQRAPSLRDMEFDESPPKLPENVAEAEAQVKAKKWCRDSGFSGALHPGYTCYREVPTRTCVPSQQVCFDPKGKREISPDKASATVSPQSPDARGECALNVPGSLCHFANDILDPTDDSCTISGPFGVIGGIALGSQLSAGSDPLVLRTVSAIVMKKLACYANVKLGKALDRRGWVPTLSVGGGSGGGSVGLGFEKLTNYELRNSIGLRPQLRLSINDLTTDRLFGGKAQFEVTGGLKLVAQDGPLGVNVSANAGMAAGGVDGPGVVWSVGAGIRLGNHYEVNIRQVHHQKGSDATFLVLDIIGGRNQNSR